MAKTTRKTTREKKLTGGFRPGRDGKRADSHSAVKLSGPKLPNGLNAIQKKRWQELLASLPETVTVTDADTPALLEMIRLEGYCRILHKRLSRNAGDRTARMNFIPFHDRWLTLAKQFGMTPASRSAVNVSSGDGDADVAGWLAKLTGGKN